LSETLCAASRKSDAHAPNLELIATDRRQLKRRPDAEQDRSSWLRYTVWDCAPGLHWVAVDEWADGKWRELKKCYTIEFLGVAAKRRGTFRHTHRVPLQTPVEKLRFRVGGLGEVKVGLGVAEPFHWCAADVGTSAHADIKKTTGAKASGGPEPQGEK